jgi:hypothetical protein
MRPRDEFRFGHKEIAELTGFTQTAAKEKLGPLSRYNMQELLEFCALHGKHDLKLDIAIYACAREKTQVSKWRDGRVNGQSGERQPADSDFCFGYDDLVHLTGLKRNTIQQLKTRNVFNPHDIRSVLVELVARFSREDVKVGLVISACENTKYREFLLAAMRKTRDI